MKKRDAVTAIFWIILGLTISIWSATFPFGSWEAPGPAIFPLACGLILIFLGRYPVLPSRKQNEERPTETFVPLIPHGAAFIRVALSLGGMLLSAVFLELLGFVLTCLLPDSFPDASHSAPEMESRYILRPGFYPRFLYAFSSFSQNIASPWFSRVLTEKWIP